MASSTQTSGAASAEDFEALSSANIAKGKRMRKATEAKRAKIIKKSDLIKITNMSVTSEVRSGNSSENEMDMQCDNGSLPVTDTPSVAPNNGPTFDTVEATTYSTVSNNVLMTNTNTVEATNNRTDSNDNPSMATDTVEAINERTNSNEEVTLYPANFSGFYLLLEDSSKCNDMYNEKITNGLTLFNKIKHLRVKDIDLIYAIGKSLTKSLLKMLRLQTTLF